MGSGVVYMYRRRFAWFVWAFRDARCKERRRYDTIKKKTGREE